ncbi:MAG: tetratricopeptide repeat protein [Vicingaceae bacterium]|nr:tetratricopeptide repeat protein [Vicingaceae bacterium]
MATGDQELIINSLKKYHNSKSDTGRINALKNICENLIHEDWVKYQVVQHNLIESALGEHKSGPLKLLLLKAKAESFNNLGIVEGNKDNIEGELAYYFKSLNIHEQLSNRKGISETYNNIGFAYKSKGEIKKATEYYYKSLKLAEDIGDEEALALSYNNLGNIVGDQGDIKKSLEFYRKSLKIQEKLNDKAGIAMCLVNIGNTLGRQGDNKNKLEYFEKALKLHQEIGNKNGIAYCFHNIAAYYGDLGDYEMSLKFFNQALEINKSLNDQDGVANTLVNIGTIQFYKGNLTEALNSCYESLNLRSENLIDQRLCNNYLVLSRIYKSKNNLKAAENYAKKALEIANLLGYPKIISEASYTLSTIYEITGDGLKAHDMYKLHVLMRDSVNNIETLKARAMQEANFKYDKQKELADAEHKKQIALKQKEKEKQQLIIYAIITGLILIVVFLFIILNRLKITKRQKTIIEVAHKEIKDSITYAKRIQSAILPPAKLVKKYLNESFVLYKPKDVVAGDFYWLETISNELSTVGYQTEKEGNVNHFETHVSSVVLFAAADCTGHGVPGAMVSVVCNNALNRSVREHGLTDPGEILTKTREIVIAEFEKSEEEVKDGMDIALCSIEGNKLQYAGAHNPLWIIRKGEIIETKANKQPIGQFDNPEPYITHSFNLEKGDSIYIFSDGYVDQFGGEKGKKFKARAFRELLLSVQDKTMEEQKAIIDEAFETWRGSLEQIDDVCVIGVRI